MKKDPESEQLRREIVDEKREAGDLKALTQHFKRMAQTIGNSPNRQLKWLVDFLATNLASLDEVKSLALRCELAYLAWYGNRNFKKRPPIPSGEKWFHRFSLISPAFGRLPVDPLEVYQKDFSQKVSAFLVQHHAEFDLDRPFNLKTKSTIHVLNKPGGKPVLYLACPTGDESLQWWLASLLTDQGQRLRHCLQCQKLFIASRTDHQSCSNKCRGLNSMRRLRKTPVDRYGKPGRPKKNER